MTPPRLTDASPDDGDAAAAVRRGLDLLLAKDMGGWAALCHDDAVVEFPFAPPGYPRRLGGRAAVEEYVADYTDHIDLHAFPSVEIHRTTAPETVIVEMRATGRTVATGEPYVMDYIAVVTVRDGRFVRYRDYWNPLALPGSTLDAKSVPSVPTVPSVPSVPADAA